MTDPLLEQEILALLHARSEALVRGDKARITELFADDFIYTNAQGFVCNRDEYLDFFVGSSEIVWQAQEISETHLLCYINTAVINWRVHDQATYRGQPFDKFFRSTHTLVKYPEGWKFFASHTSLISEE